MKEEQYRKADFLIKVVALLGAGSAFAYGVYQYSLDNEREFKRVFVEEQLETCKEVSTLVASVAQIKDNKERSAKSVELSALYFGRAALTLNDETMRHFRTFIDITSNAHEEKPINEYYYGNLGSYQFAIAQACRNYLIDSWDVKLERLTQQVWEPRID